MRIVMQAEQPSESELTLFEVPAVFLKPEAEAEEEIGSEIRRNLTARHAAGDDWPFPGNPVAARIAVGTGGALLRRSDRLALLGPLGECFEVRDSATGKLATPPERWLRAVVSTEWGALWYFLDGEDRAYHRSVTIEAWRSVARLLARDPDATIRLARRNARVEDELRRLLSWGVRAPLNLDHEADAQLAALRAADWLEQVPDEELLDWLVDFCWRYANTKPEDPYHALEWEEGGLFVEPRTRESVAVALRQMSGPRLRDGRARRLLFSMIKKGVIMGFDAHIRPFNASP